MAAFIRFIPTAPEEIDAFFLLAPVSASDVVYDLGSGDGRLLFAALEKGAGRAVGVELDPECVRTARATARNMGLEDRVTFVEGDVMETDLSDATVVLCYLVTAASIALRPKLEAELKTGARVVMESFPVPGWRPVDTLDYWWKMFYLYRMPPSTMSGPSSSAEWSECS